MTKTITKMQVIDTLRTLVDQHGADTVRSNRYVNHSLNVPNCIAGCFFFAWGVSLSTLSANEGTCVNELALSWPLDGIELTEAATEVLHDAQSAQDTPSTWGVALGAALDTAEEWGDEE